MKYDFSFGQKDRELIKSIVGKRLESYRLNDTNDTSFEIFVLRFPDTDIEFATNEIVGTGDWFEETNTVQVAERPMRDSWSRVGKSDPDNGISEGQFRDYPVGEIVRSVSVIHEMFSCGKESGAFVRGVVLDFGDKLIVFDKGAYNWEAIWRVHTCQSSSLPLPQAEFDPIEESDLGSRTSIESL